MIILFHIDELAGEIDEAVVGVYDDIDVVEEYLMQTYKYYERDDDRIECYDEWPDVQRFRVEEFRTNEIDRTLWEPQSLCSGFGRKEM